MLLSASVRHVTGLQGCGDKYSCSWCQWGWGAEGRLSAGTASWLLSSADLAVDEFVVIECEHPCRHSMYVEVPICRPR